MPKWSPSSVHSSKYFIVVSGKDCWGGGRGSAVQSWCLVMCACWRFTLWDDDGNTCYTIGGGRRYSRYLWSKIIWLCFHLWTYQHPINNTNCTSSFNIQLGKRFERSAQMTLWLATFFQTSLNSLKWKYK